MQMTSRERVLKALKHEEADRVAIHDGTWTSTIIRWKTEGLPPEIPVEEYACNTSLMRTCEGVNSGFDFSWP